VPRAPVYTRGVGPFTVCRLRAVERQSRDLTMVDSRKLTSWERATVDVSKPAEVIGWCNKWRITPERLKAVVAQVGNSAASIAEALGKVR
jgi:hypothetical protein